MNYQKVYNQIIERARGRELEGYRERHHILPRSMGGDDSPENLVDLTAREHFVCHWLLTKIHPQGRMHHKAIHAFAMMAWCSNSNQERLKANSRLYERLRIEFRRVMSRSQRGEKNSQHGTKWAHNLAQKVSQRFPRDAELPPGWCWGRIINWDRLTDKRNYEIECAERKRQRQQGQQIKKKEIEKQRELARLRRQQQTQKQGREKNAEYFERYQNGESLRSIAKGAGCSHVALLYRFRRYFPNELNSIGH